MRTVVVAIIVATVVVLVGWSLRPAKNDEPLFETPVETPAVEKPILPKKATPSRKGPQTVASAPLSEREQKLKDLGFGTTTHNWVVKTEGE